MTNPTNLPAEAAMQPRWAIVLRNGKTSQGLYHHEKTAKAYADAYYSEHVGPRISELMERAEHERQMAVKDKEIERLQRDAARYQWLRSRDVDTVYSGGVLACLTPDNKVLNGEHLEAAVYAAIDGI